VNKSKKIPIKRRPTAEEEDAEAFEFLESKLDHDLLVMTATAQNLIKKTTVTLKSAVEAIDAKLKDLDVAMTDVQPRISLSKEQSDWLWNRTLVSEEILRKNSEQKKTQESLRSEFEQALGTTLQSVDATKLLESPMWQEVFHGLG